ncbi:MAG: hypothetical protein JO353_06955, partial [Phycisphaerae bacterium]|nr:hypothetical protein [Phycisphaerae bacterium]
MAVTTVEPIWERRRSSYRDSKIVHYLLWLVTCNDPFDGTAAAINANGVPQDGDAYVDPAGNVCYLSGIDADPRQGSDRHFEVMVEFTDDQTATADDNPLHAAPTFAWSYENTTEQYFIDNSDSSVTNAAGDTGPFNVVNSAGEAFEQLPVRDKGWLVITMARNEATHSAAADDVYSNTVNHADVQLDGTTYAAGTLKMSPIAATKNQKLLRSGTNVVYYAKTYTFKARHEGWHDKPLDVGFNELIGTKTTNTLNLRRIVDQSGAPVTKPWPLDGTGKKK